MMFAEPSAIDQGAHSTKGSACQNAHEHFDASVGLILILLGGLFLAQQVFGPNLWHWFWPFLIVAPGALFLAAAFAFSRGASGLAIPGSIITTVGMILLFQNSFHAWVTWAYAWALVVPTSIGLGIWLHGWLSGQTRALRTGRIMAMIGLWLFVGFAAFFEGILNISGGFGQGIAGSGIGVALVVGGLYFIAQKSDASATA